MGDLIHSISMPMTPESIQLAQISLLNSRCVYATAFGMSPSEWFNGTSDSTFCKVEIIFTLLSPLPNYSSHSVPYLNGTITHPATQASHPCFLTSTWPITSYEVLSDLPSKYILNASASFHLHCLDFGPNPVLSLSSWKSHRHLKLVSLILLPRPCNQLSIQQTRIFLKWKSNH